MVKSAGWQMGPEEFPQTLELGLRGCVGFQQAAAHRMVWAMRTAGTKEVMATETVYPTTSKSCNTAEGKVQCRAVKARLSQSSLAVVGTSCVSW